MFKLYLSRLRIIRLECVNFAEGLGASARIESLLRKSWIRPYFPMIFVKYTFQV